MIETNPGFEFEILDNSDLTAGQMTLLQEAKAEIDNVATNANTRDDRVRSGRAEIARQQAGTMELGPIFDGHTHWKKRVYRQCWNRIKQFWDDERWIRVTDDETNLKWVGLNRPVTVGEQIQNDIQELPPEQTQNPAFQQALQQISQDPRMSQQVSTENDVAELDMDIIIEDAPDYPTIQAEQFDQLINVLQTGANIPLSDPRWQLIIKASQLRNKDEIIDFLKGDPEAAQAAQAEEAEIADLGKKREQAEIDETRTKSRLNLANTRKALADAKESLADAGARMSEIDSKAQLNLANAQKALREEAPA